jgi:hypothetical protein
MATTTATRCAIGDEVWTYWHGTLGRARVVRVSTTDMSMHGREADYLLGYHVDQPDIVAGTPTQFFPSDCIFVLSDRTTLIERIKSDRWMLDFYLERLGESGQ